MLKGQALALIVKFSTISAEFHCFKIFIIIRSNQPSILKSSFWKIQKRVCQYQITKEEL